MPHFVPFQQTTAEYGDGDEIWICPDHVLYYVRVGDFITAITMGVCHDGESTILVHGSVSGVLTKLTTAGMSVTQVGENPNFVENSTSAEKQD